jgi:hypothetical protein
MRRRRLPRILLNAATAVSLVLCLTTVVLWVRSYWRWEYVVYGTSHRHTAVHSRAGQFLFRTERPESGTLWPRPTFFGKSLATERSDDRLTKNPSGFAWYAGRVVVLHTDEESDLINAVAPAWFISLALAALPCARTARSAWRRFRPAAEGHCPACGYDLRATPDRCPECGTPTPAPRRTSCGDRPCL